MALTHKLVRRLRSPAHGSDAFIERYRRINMGQLEIQITIDDPKAYTMTVGQ
jgi:hypothetical protein